jgi:hypothetical protein
MRPIPAAARLRREQVGADETVNPRPDTAYRPLRELPSLLGEADCAIIDQAMALGYVGYSKSAMRWSSIGAVSGTRIRRLIASAARLKRFAETLLGEATDLGWSFNKAMLTALATHLTAAPSPTGRVRTFDEYDCLRRMADRHFDPPPAPVLLGQPRLGDHRLPHPHRLQEPHLGGAQDHQRVVHRQHRGVVGAAEDEAAVDQAAAVGRYLGHGLELDPRPAGRQLDRPAAQAAVDRAVGVGRGIGCGAGHGEPIIRTEPRRRRRGATLY